jgi:hypothetical protein
MNQQQPKNVIFNQVSQVDFNPDNLEQLVSFDGRQMVLSSEPHNWPSYRPTQNAIYKKYLQKYSKHTAVDVNTKDELERQQLLLEKPH